MSSTNNADVLNAVFAAQMDTPSGREKIAGLGSDFVQDRVREDGFAGKILPRRTVTVGDLQRSPNSDTLVYLCETAPRQRAMSSDFNGQPGVNFYTAARFEVGFMRINSERFEQTRNNLMANKAPITDIIKKNIANDIHEIEDRILLVNSEKCVQSVQEDANGLTFGATYADADAFTAYNVAQGNVLELGKVKGIDAIQNSAVANSADSCDEDLIYPIQKDDVIKLLKLFPGRGGARNGRLRCSKLLITDTDLLDLSSWTNSDVGELAKDTAVRGWKANTIVGADFTRTLKTDLLRPGNVFAYAAPEYLGGFLVLNKTEFFADKERDRYSFEAYEDIAIYFANVAAVRKLELYAGSVERLTTDVNNAAYKVDYMPFEEEDLGQLNNLVEEGQTHPAITQF